MDTVLHFLQEYPIIWKILSALIIFLVGRLLAKLVVKLATRMMMKVEVETISAAFIGKFIYLTLILLSLLIALGQLGVQTTSLIAVIGAAGLAIGLALQSTLSNFASGIMLVVFKPFRKNDMIINSGVEGAVEEIGIFTTIIRDDFNLCHVIPNSKLTGGNITNIWSNVERRLEFNMGVGLHEDLDRVFAILDAQLAAHPLVLDEPGHFIGVRSMEHSSVNLLVWVYIHRANFKMVRFRLYKEMKQALAQEGIALAFPQRDVHLKRELPVDEITA